MQGRRGWLRLHEKGGKERELPCHYNPDEYLDAHIAGGPDGLLFRTTGRMTGQQQPIWQAMRDGICLPNRSPYFCSYKACGFASVCETEFCGRPRGGDEDLASRLPPMAAG